MDTGDVHVVGIVRKPRHSEAFTMMWCQPLDALLRTEGRRHPDDSPLRLSDLRVLLHLVANCEYRNVFEGYIAEIARSLKCDRSTVRSALDALSERDLVRS